jgi:KDO2-lipid IV(A) lauroyltransferase
LTFIICYPRSRIAIENLHRSMGSTLSRAACRRAIIGMFQNFGRDLVEFFRLPLMHNSRVRAETLSRIRVEGEEHLRGALQMRRGVLILTAHLGNWELMAAWIALQGIPINVLSRPIRQPALNDLCQRVRHEAGIHTIFKKNSIREIITRLKKNEVVGFVLDQRVNRREGVVVNFFGRPAGTISGLATLSARYDVPVVPLFIHRVEGDRHLIIAEPPIRFESTGDMERDIVDYTQRYSDVLERHIRRSPEQWIWLHKRWEP